MQVHNITITFSSFSMLTTIGPTVYGSNHSTPLRVTQYQGSRYTNVQSVSNQNISTHRTQLQTHRNTLSCNKTLRTKTFRSVFGRPAAAPKVGRSATRPPGISGHIPVPWTLDLQLVILFYHHLHLRKDRLTIN